MIDDGAEFAEQVLALYKSTIAKTNHSKCCDSDLRRVAFGLDAFRHALDHVLESHRADPLRLTAAGVYEADDILTALRSGTAHPIWKYLESLKSSGERHNRPPPGEREQMIRSMLAAAVLAYKDVTDCTKKNAANAIAAGIHTADRSFSADQLLQWARRSDRANWFAGQFKADARFVPDDCPDPGQRILVVVREALHPLLAIPV